MKCAAHPGVETNLSCGKCGKPICPRCMVQTPVGAKCPDCANLYRLPTFRVSTQYYLRAVGSGLGVAVACGLIWGAVMIFISFFYINLLVAAGVGYALGEVVSLSVNRKRGTGLAVVGGVAVVISYAVSFWFISFLLGVPFLLGFHFSLLRMLLDLLALVLGIFVAVARLR